MKNILMFILAACCCGLLSAQETYCTRVVVLENSATTLSVQFEMSSSADFGLGSGNLRLSFDPDVLSNPTLLRDGLSSPPYNPSTVTNPARGVVSYNYELLSTFNGAFPAKVVPSGDGNWAVIGSISFEKNAGAIDEPIAWIYSPGETTGTVVFKEDETSLLQATDETCLANVSAAALPASYRFFDAVKLGKIAYLSWETETESENYGFHVQHSTDGQNFTKIGFVEGENQAAGYDFAHDNPLSGVNYYRLLQEDLDGAIDISDVRTVIFDNSNLAVFPNPVNDVITVQGTEITEKTLLRLWDLRGRQVMKVQGQNQLTVKTLNSGHYILEVVTDRSSTYTQVIISR